MMPRMTKDEVLHLAALSRVKLTDEEADHFNNEIEAILSYVSTINDIAADYQALTKVAGPVHNIFREDTITNEPGSYTKDLHAAFPESEGPYLKVKKILNPDN